jgi:hypothetical protein
MLLEAGPRQREDRHGLHRSARERCTPDEWDTAQREGPTLGFGDAIAYALEE